MSKQIDKQKSKVIGLLHSLSADADIGDSRLTDGSFLTDRVSEIIREVGKWPEHGVPTHVPTHNKRQTYWCDECMHHCTTDCCDHYNKEGERIR